MDILSNRLLLTEISRDDAEDIHRLHSFPEVDEFNTIGIPGNIEETKALIHPMIERQSDNPRKSFTWKILTGGQHEFIGLAGMNLSCDNLNWEKSIINCCRGIGVRDMLPRHPKRSSNLGLKIFICIKWKPE
jgi:hypothetical protein